MVRKPQKIRVVGATLQTFALRDLADLIRKDPKFFGINEKSNDIYIDSYGSDEITVYKYALESDAVYNKRIEDHEKAKAYEKKRVKEGKSQIEAQEKDTLKKLLHKYGNL